MIWVLRSHCLLEHLTSTTITAAYTTAETVNSMTPDMRWENDEATAMHTIAALIPNSMFTNVKFKTTTKDLWDALKVLFEGRTQMVIVKTSQQLQNTQCSEDDNVHEHFDKLVNLHEHLASMGKSIPENEYFSILMGSLPKSYSAMLGSIAAAAELSGNPVSPTIVVKIATDEYNRHTMGTEKSKEEAFATDPQKKKPKHDVECEHCHKKGHTKPECYAKGSRDKGRWKRNWKKKRNGNKSNVAALSDHLPDIEAWSTVESIEDVDVDPHVSISVAQGTAEPQMELYDSRASHHISPFHEQFITY
jgi:hypothetical protein